MAAALDDARAAGAADDVPVGAVIVRDGDAIARASNRTIRDQDPTAHAEMLAIRAAASVLGAWHLGDCTLYVTLEPCVMCAGALLSARVGRLVYGAADLKAGATASLYNVCADPRLNHNPPVTHGVLAEQAAALLSAFFDERRPG